MGYPYTYGRGIGTPAYHNAAGLGRLLCGKQRLADTTLTGIKLLTQNVAQQTWEIFLVLALTVSMDENCPAASSWVC